MSWWKKSSIICERTWGGLTFQSTAGSHPSPPPPSPSGYAAAFAKGRSPWLNFLLVCHFLYIIKWNNKANFQLFILLRIYSDRVCPLCPYLTVASVVAMQQAILGGGSLLHIHCYCICYMVAPYVGWWYFGYQSGCPIRCIEIQLQIYGVCNSFKWKSKCFFSAGEYDSILRELHL